VYRVIRSCRLALWLLAAVAAVTLGKPVLAQDAPSAEQAASLFNDKKWKEAAAAYEAITKKDPKAAVAWFRRAYCLHMDGDYKGALDAHKKAAEFPAFRAAALYNVSCAQARLGDKDAAFAALGRAMENGFAAKQAMEEDEDLAVLHEDSRWKKSLEKLDEYIKLYRAFDFWVGDWDVFGPKGKQVGTNKIERLEGGHLILENWTNSQGVTGKSMNFVDPVDKRWKQVWIAQNGWVVRYDGEFKDGAMRFQGTSVLKDGKKEHSRATFTPLPEGRVRQVLERSSDGERWSIVFDGTYVPKKDAASK
jgi:tetratricopeptide (TPR) repeat protein